MISHDLTWSPMVSQVTASKEELDRLFDTFDVNSDGRLSVDELKPVSSGGSRTCWLGYHELTCRLACPLVATDCHSRPLISANCDGRSSRSSPMWPWLGSSSSRMRSVPSSPRWGHRPPLPRPSHRRPHTAHLRTAAHSSTALEAPQGAPASRGVPLTAAECPRVSSAALEAPQGAGRVCGAARGASAGGDPREAQVHLEARHGYAAATGHHDRLCLPLLATASHCFPLLATACNCLPPLLASACLCLPLLATACHCLPELAMSCHRSTIRAPS